MKVTYLDHSGFCVETDRSRLIFDFWRDPAKALEIKPDKKIYVFASHAHGDHFNRAIFDLPYVLAYILSSDIEESGLKQGEKINFIAPYEQLAIGDLKVKTYGSTDEGVSFAVEVDGVKIFHAGDLNWWHWKEDTQENIKQAEKDFFRELNLLAGQEFDLAFFPVDSRLEEYRDIGIKEFIKVVKTGSLVTMHSCGQVLKLVDFHPNLWCPELPGEVLEL